MNNHQIIVKARSYSTTLQIEPFRRNLLKAFTIYFQVVSFGMLMGYNQQFF